MRITNRELNRYRKELDKRSLNAKAYVLARLRSEAKDLSNVADARNATIEIIRDALGMYGDEAQVVASTLFDEICEAEGIKASSEIFDNVIDDELMQKKVRYYAEKIEDDWQGYEKSNADLITYYVTRSAYENIIRNCKKNHVRYARVPSGRETCAFCFMLSSRGFSYLTKATAEMHGLHPHCDCIVVPGKDGKTKISGYDPDGMAKRFRQCQNTVGVKTVNKLNRKQVFKEIETRDWEWLYTGKMPKIDYADNPRSRYGKLLIDNNYEPKNIINKGNEWRDLFVHDTLMSNGFSIKTNGFKDLDLKINDNYWEVKSPQSPLNNPKPERKLAFIENNLRAANNQFKKRGLEQTNVILNFYYRDFKDTEVINEVEKRMKQHKINEVICLFQDGKVRRIKNTR